MAKGSQLCLHWCWTLPLAAPILENLLGTGTEWKEQLEARPAAGAAQDSAFSLRKKVFVTKKGFGTDNPKSPI